MTAMSSKSRQASRPSQITRCGRAHQRIARRPFRIDRGHSGQIDVTRNVVGLL
jgi:hypothetical protein